MKVWMQSQGFFSDGYHIVTTETMQKHAAICGFQFSADEEMIGDSLNENDVDCEACKARHSQNLAPENETQASFRRAWGQVMRGETHDISTLWDGWDDEDESE